MAARRGVGAVRSGPLPGFTAGPWRGGVSLRRKKRKRRKGPAEKIPITGQVTEQEVEEDQDIRSWRCRADTRPRHGPAVKPGKGPERPPPTPRPRANPELRSHSFVRPLPDSAHRC